MPPYEQPLENLRFFEKFKWVDWECFVVKIEG